MQHPPRLFHVVCILGWLLLVTIGVGYAAPNLVNYQGVLTLPNGTVVNGQVSLQLSLYNVASGGTPLWQEAQTVDVTQGLFNVQLGSVTPLTLPFDAPYFLGVKAGSDPEMQPRQQLTSVPYALRANIADTVPDQAVTAAKLGEACGDGEILRFNAQSGLWQCSSSNDADSFFTTHSGAGVLTIEGITDPEPVIPHDGSALDPDENIFVYDFTALDIIGASSGYLPQISPLIVLCDPNGKGPIVFEKILRSQVLTSIALWLPDGSGTLIKVVEISNATIYSQDTISPSRPGDESLVQYAITGEVIKVLGEYFHTPGASIIYNRQSNTVEGGCGDDVPDFVLDYGLNSVLPGERIDTLQTDVSYSPPAPDGNTTSRPDFGPVDMESSLNSSSLCLIEKALKGTAQTELSILTPSAMNPDTAESQLTLGAVRVLTYKIGLDSRGVAKQHFSLFVETIVSSYTTIDPDTGQATGTTSFGWDLTANGPL